MHRRPTLIQIRRLDDLSGLRSVGDDQKVVLLRALIAAGLIFVGAGGPVGGETGTPGKRPHQQRAPRLMRGCMFCLV
jgi:hypothetical protein